MLVCKLTVIDGALYFRAGNHKLKLCLSTRAVALRRVSTALLKLPHHPSHFSKSHQPTTLTNFLSIPPFNSQSLSRTQNNGRISLHPPHILYLPRLLHQPHRPHNGQGYPAARRRGNTRCERTHHCAPEPSTSSLRRLPRTIANST